MVDPEGGELGGVPEVEGTVLKHSQSCSRWKSAIVVWRQVREERNTSTPFQCSIQKLTIYIEYH